MSRHHASKMLEAGFPETDKCSSPVCGVVEEQAHIAEGRQLYKQRERLF